MIQSLATHMKVNQIFKFSDGTTVFAIQISRSPEKFPCHVQLYLDDQKVEDFNLTGKRMPGANLKKDEYIVFTNDEVSTSAAQLEKSNCKLVILD